MVRSILMSTETIKFRKNIRINRDKTPLIGRNKVVSRDWCERLSVLHSFLRRKYRVCTRLSLFVVCRQIIRKVRCNFRIVMSYENQWKNNKKTIWKIIKIRSIFVEMQWNWFLKTLINSKVLWHRLFLILGRGNNMSN